MMKITEKKIHLKIYLKLHSVSFASLSPFMFENFSYLQNYLPCVGLCSCTAPERMNLMF